MFFSSSTNLRPEVSNTSSNVYNSTTIDDFHVTIDKIFKVPSLASQHQKTKHHRDAHNNSYFWEIDQMTIPTLNNNKIRNLHIKPGKSDHFIYYFMVSCYIPIITAVTGPISHMFSIACLVNKWRVSKKTHDEVKDSSLVLILNCISLFIGGLSNFVLLLHFSGKIKYIVAQKVNIIGWTISGLILLIDIVLFRCAEFDSKVHEKGIGFWFAVYTCILYFMCGGLLCLHLMGYKKGKYKATFNLSHDERAVMLYTFGFQLWLLWGAWLYSKCLFSNVSYGVSLYSVLCGALTVGFGDVFSHKTSGRIISMFYFLSSIIIIGLIISLTSQIIKNTFQPIIHLHLCERARIKAVRRVEGYNLHFDQGDGSFTTDDVDAFFDSGDIINTESFAFYAYKKGNNYTDVIQYTEMRRLHVKYKRLAKNLGFMSALSFFLVFWLFGAMVFKFSEGWTYFDSMYFAFLDCLLTIGYGDFILTTGSSRAFFVLFALAAIPLMTSLINAIGDSLSTIGWSFVKYVVIVSQGIYQTLFYIFEGLCNLLGKKITNTTSDEDDNNLSKRPLPFNLSFTKSKQLKEELHDLLQVSYEINDMKEDTHISEYEYHLLDSCMKLSRDYEVLSNTSPDYKLSFQEWIDYFKLSFYTNREILHTKHFWLSSESPIRFDTNEPRFIYLQLTHQLSEYIKTKKNSISNIEIDDHVLGRNRDNSSD
ncbi:hypothetical protein ACO0R3_002202 [Hanseniaspora guilliermondii]